MPRRTSQNRSEIYDVAVIGAGIVGCSTALYLAKQGLKVIVCDRGKVGGEQSSRAWGFIRKQGRHHAEIPLADLASGLWDELTETYGFEATRHTKAGVIMPAETDADEAIIDRAYASAQALGLPSRLLTPAELAEKCPELKSGWRAALFTEGDGHAEPQVATATVRKAAEAHGATFAEGRTVTGFELQGFSVQAIQTTGGPICAGSYVIAGGIGSRKLLGALGYNAPIQIIRSSVFKTTKGRQFTDIAMWCPQVSFRPGKDGSFVIGNGYRGAGTDYDITLESISNVRYFFPAFLRNSRQLKLTIGAELARSFSDCLSSKGRHAALPEPVVNTRKVRFNLDQLNALFPGETDYEVSRQWAGRLDITPDLIPIIDRLDCPNNVFTACGFSGHGFALGPSIGLALADWITKGAPGLDLSAFKHTRFVSGDYEVVKAM